MCKHQTTATLILKTQHMIKAKHKHLVFHSFKITEKDYLVRKRLEAGLG
jgi:hypothetical protein